MLPNVCGCSIVPPKAPNVIKTSKTFCTSYRADVKEAWDKQGAVPLKMSPAELDKFLRADIAAQMPEWASCGMVNRAT